MAILLVAVDFSAESMYPANLIKAGNYIPVIPEVEIV